MKDSIPGNINKGKADTLHEFHTEQTLETEGRDGLVSAEIWEGLETSLYDTTVTQSCQMLIKTHKVHITKSIPWCELWTLGYSRVSVCLHWSKYRYTGVRFKVDM